MFNRNIFFACESCTSVIEKENQTEEAHKKKTCGRKKPQNEASQNQSEDATAILTGAIGRLLVDDSEEVITIDTEEATNQETPESPIGDTSKEPKGKQPSGKDKTMHLLPSKDMPKTSFTWDKYEERLPEGWKM